MSYTSYFPTKIGEHMQSEIEWLKTTLFNNNEECILETDDLISIALSFPAVLVAMSDGNLDLAEKRYLANIAKQLGDEVTEKNDSDVFAFERYFGLKSLLNLEKHQQSKLLDLLATFCKHDSELSYLIWNSMSGVAEASEGVSKSEAQTMQMLREKLKLKLN